MGTVLTAYNQPGGSGLLLDRSGCATTRVWWVQSTATYASDSAGYGRHPDTPFATLDYLVSNATTLGLSAYDRVIIGPGHNEGLGNDQWAIATASVTIEAHELAVGELAPIFDFDHANSSIDITANNVTLKGIKLRPSVTSVLIGVHVATDVTGTRLLNCEWINGEDGAGVDEFVKDLYLQSGNHDTIIRGCKFLNHASSTHATHGIHIAAASNRITFENNVMYGTWSTGGIVEAAAGTQHVFRGNAIASAGTNISWHVSSTFAARSGSGSGVGNEDAGAVEDVTGNLIGRNDSDNAADTSSVVANADGSLLERDEYIKSLILPFIGAACGTGVYPTGFTDDSAWAMLLSKSATASASSYNNTTDSLEAISDALGAGTGCTTALGAANLDHLALTADGTDVYPATLGNDTILAMMMCKGATATASTFNNTTDSLEALSDALAAGTGCSTALAAIHMDHLFGVADGTGAYPASVVEDSAWAMLLSKSNPAVATSYDNTTDSLEAISDQAKKIDLVTMGTVVAGSLAAVVERCVEKSDGAVLAAADPIFTIAGGPIYVESLVGIVSTGVTGASNAKYSITTTTPAATVDLSAAAVAIDDDAAGTIYTNVGATAVFTPTTNGIGVLGLIAGAADQPHWILPPGTVNFTCDAARTGVVKFYLRYKPLSPNSLVTAAA